MRNKIAMLVVASAMAFANAGCTPEQVQAAWTLAQVVPRVQQYTQQACGFLPTANTINALLKAFNVTSQDQAVQMANQICATVTKAQARRGGSGGPVLRGVRIEGRFVR